MMRSIVIKFRDGTEKVLPISKATSIKSKSNFQTVAFEMLADGTFRLTWTEGLIPDMTQVSAFEVRREDDQETG